jgi:uncharacterized membrane protein YcaP (DUF421 family)
MDFLTGVLWGHVFLRTAAMFLVALVVIRLMGNRILGQMTPFDYVIVVGIGDIVASVALDRNENLWVGAEALVMLLVLNFVLSYFSLKNIKFRHLIEGSPVQLIKEGSIIRQNLSKAHFNNDDLRQEMHKLGMELDSIKDVKEAWLEGCGHFTVVKKQSAEPVSLQDMQNIINSSVAPGQLPATAISQATLEELVGSVNQLIKVVKAQQASDGQVEQSLQPLSKHQDNGIH